MKKVIRILEFFRKFAFGSVLIFSGGMALVIWDIGSSGESLSNNQYGLIAIILVLWGIVGVDEILLNRIEQIRKERDETKKEAAEREKIIMQSVRKKVEEVYSIDKVKNNRIEMLKKKVQALKEKLPLDIIEEIEEKLVEEMKKEEISSVKKKNKVPSAEKLASDSFGGKISK